MYRCVVCGIDHSRSIWLHQPNDGDMVCSDECADVWNNKRGIEKNNSTFHGWRINGYLRY